MITRLLDILRCRFVGHEWENFSDRRCCKRLYCPRAEERVFITHQVWRPIEGRR